MARKFKRYLLKMQDLIQAFNREVLPGYFVALPVGCGIPGTAIVRSVGVDYARQCLDLIVEDESFAEVAECCEIPVADGCCWIERRAYRIVEVD